MADNNNNDMKKLDDNALADVAGGLKWTENGFCCERCGGTSFESKTAMLCICTECGLVQTKIPKIDNPQDLFNN